MKIIQKAFTTISLLVTLLVFSSSAYAACGKVKLGDFDWDSANVHTAITQFILEKGYGCKVEVTKGSTSPIMAALYDQQLDIVTEVWRDNIVQQIMDNIAKGNIIELGINTPESGQGFYVTKLLLTSMV